MTMEYKGVIKNSRTLDLTAFSQIIDTIAPVFVLYAPEQLGITIPAYMAIRMGLNGLSAYLRFKTTAPVGEK